MAFIIVLVAITTSALTWIFAKINLVSDQNRHKIVNIEQDDMEKQNLFTGSYKLQDDICSESKCLFYEYNKNTNDFSEGWPIGIIKIRGYYKKDTENNKILPIGCDKVDASMGCIEYEAEKCDRFVVTDGYEKIAPSFGRAEDKTIKIKLEGLSESEEEIIGEGYSPISEMDKDVILKSNKDKEIQLVLLALKPELTAEADYCYSGVHILKVIE